MLLKDGDGQYIWRAGLEAGRPSVILGYPVRYAADMPAVAGNGAPEGEKVLSSLDDAVETAKDSKRPILLMVSRPTWRQ